MNNDELITFKIMKYPFFRFISWMFIYGALITFAVSVLFSVFELLFFKRIIYSYNSEFLEEVANMILIGEHVGISILVFFISSIVVTHLAFKQVLLKQYVYIEIKPYSQKISPFIALTYIGLNKVFSSFLILLILLSTDHSWILQCIHFFRYRQMKQLWELLIDVSYKYFTICSLVLCIVCYFIFKIVLLKNARIEIK